MALDERLGELLRSAGFGGRRSMELLAEGGGAIAPVGSLRALGRTEDARMAVLLRLFGYSQDVEREQAEQALAPLGVAELAAAGLIDIDGTAVRSGLRLSDFHGLLLAGDAPRDVEPEQHVMALSTASQLTAYLTVRREVATALDLGTGSGVHALLAARHAEHVVGVDINARALELAALNERLNGVPDGRCSWVQGSWLDPVEDERFDLVVANPPYVISPDNILRYRDSERGGDELSREVVRGCARVLAEDGFATVMCSWIHREDAWDAPVREWVAGLGCDALLLHLSSQRPLPYAISWNRGRAESDPRWFAETVDRWVAHLQAADVERIATGFVVLRRRSARENWFGSFHGIAIPQGPGGEQLERIFAGGDVLGSRRGAGLLAELLSRPWELLDRHRLDQSAIYEGGAYAGEGRMSRQPDTGVHATVEPRVLPVLLGCDGSRPLGELLNAAPVPEGLDRAGFHSLCLGTVRDLIARGYLLPVD